MVLANDEVVVKEWEYASAKRKMLETKYTLTVTNKRIISQTKSARRNTHDEIRISDVKSISSSHETVSKAMAIFLMLLGVAVFIAGLVVSSKLGEAGFAVVILGLIVGALVAYKGYLRLDQGTFVLTIKTKGKEGESLYVSAEKVLNNPFKGLFAGKVRVKINNEVSEEIVETLGALVM